MNATQDTTANLLICALRPAAGCVLHLTTAELDLCRAIFRFHLDADALKKGGRQNPAGAHDDRVVPDLHLPPRLLDLDVVATDPFDVRLKQDVEAAGPACSFHLLAILPLGA